MENNITEQELQSKKDISNKWLDNIFDSLQRLEVYERQLKTGYEDISRYLTNLRYPNPSVSASFTQLKMIPLMITEIEILLNNSEKVIKKNKIKELKNKKNEVIKIHNEKPIYGVKRKDGKHVSLVIFKEEFYDIVGLLSDIRKAIVSELSHILWVGKEDKEEEETGGEV